MGQVLFLNYHSLDTGRRGSAYHVDPVYSVSQTAFEAQLQLIADLRIPVLSLASYLEQVRERRPFHENALVITFDDGFLTDYEVAYPRLKAFGFAATFFVCLSNLTSQDRWLQLRAMIQDGYEVGSHTLTHQYLTELGASELARELGESKRIIQAETGARVRFLAPPGGRFNAVVTRAALAAGYESLLTTRVGVNDHASDPMALSRWSVRYRTSLQEFERMVTQQPGAVRAKELKSRALNLSKRLLGNRAFDQLRSAILAARP